MKRILFIAFILSVLLSSCSKSDGPTYTDFSGTYYGKWVDASGNTGNVEVVFKEWTGYFDFRSEKIWVQEIGCSFDRFEHEKGEIARIKIISSSADVYDFENDVDFSTTEAQKYIPLEYKLYEYKGKKVIESLVPSTSGLRVIK
mgnify:FL=1